MTACSRGPDLGSHSGSLFVERKHNTVCDECLESLHLPMQRLPVSNRDTISAQAFEHRDRSDRQPAEFSQVGQRLFADARLPSAELRQRVGVEDRRLTIHRLSVPAPRAFGSAGPVQQQEYQRDWQLPTQESQPAPARYRHLLRSAGAARQSPVPRNFGHSVPHPRRFACGVQPECEWCAQSSILGQRLVVS